MTDLYMKSSYITSDNYIGGRIVEYDMKSANINALRSIGKIDEKLYDYLSGLPKHDRQVYIGMMLNTKKLQPNTIIVDTIRECRRMLFEANDIQEEEVVRIASDAVYINRPVDLVNTKFNDYIEFRKKSESFAMLGFDRNRVLVFYRIEFDGTIDITVKGMSEEAQKLHQNHMLVFIANMIYHLQSSMKKDVIGYYQSFYEQYLNRVLPIGYYREFNAVSCYRIQDIYVQELQEDARNVVDISHNLEVLRDIWSVILRIYL